MAVARWVRWLCTTTLLLVTYFVVPVGAQPRGGIVLRVVLSVIVFAAATVLLVDQVRLTIATPDRQLYGLLTAIALAWCVFSLAFYIIARHQPGQVAGLNTRIDGLYFTASTMLTIGYGDVHAVGQLARGLVLVQMLFDVVFIAGAAGLVTNRLRSRAVDRGKRAAERPPRQGWASQRKSR